MPCGKSQSVFTRFTAKWLAGTEAAIPNLISAGFCSIQLIPRVILILQACYSLQACQANTHLDLGCFGQEPLRSGTAKPLQGQLASPDKSLLSHCVCRSFEDLHRQNWLARPGPRFFRKFCTAWNSYLETHLGSAFQPAIRNFPVIDRFPSKKRTK